MSDKTTATEQDDYTASSLATAAGVTFSHVARLCREGRIPARKFGSSWRSWQIRYEDGQRWLAERQAKHAQL